MDAVDVGRVFIMLVFSGVNLALCWLNYFDMASPIYRSGVVVGPATPTALTALFVVTIMASVVCGVETLNALSLLVSHGRPRLPLEMEQCLALLAGSIPLAAVNLSVVVCRMRNHTPLQISCCVFLVLNFVVRMLYARAFSHEYKSCGATFKVSVQVFDAVLFVLLLVLAGLIWGRVNVSFRPPRPAGSEWLRGVSVLLIRAPALEGRLLEQYDLTRLVRMHNIPKNKPWLVKDLFDVAEKRDNAASASASASTSDSASASASAADVHGDPSYSVNYACLADPGELLQPDECAGFTQLRFHFRYNNNWQWSPGRPMGLISYNFAQVRGGADGLCVQANRTLGGDWRMFYFSVKLQTHTNWTVAVMVNSPWKQSCTVPFPLYDPNIPVCPS